MSMQPEIIYLGLGLYQAPLLATMFGDITLLFQALAYFSVKGDESSFQKVLMRFNSSHISAHGRYSIHVYFSLS